MSGRAGSSTRKRARPYNNNTRGRRNSNNSNNNNNNNSEDTVVYKDRNDAMQIRLTDFAKTIFGDKTVSKLMERGINPRKLWSLSTNITQCNNVIGTHKGNCWICETPIRNVDGLAPECEHILPVAQAVIFLSLYSAKRKYGRPQNNNYAKMAKDPEFENYVKEFPPLKINAKSDKAGYDMLYHLEYGWAHQICNQEKSDICAIVSDNGKAKVSIENVEYILKKIYKSRREGHEKLHELFKEKGYTTEDKFLNGTKSVNGTKIIKGCKEHVLKRYNEIVNFLNKDGAKDMDRFNLTLLSGVVTALDITNMHEKGRGLIDPDYLKRQKEIKEIIDAKINKSISEQMESLTIIYDSIEQYIKDIMNKNIPEIIKKPFPFLIDKDYIKDWVNVYVDFIGTQYSEIYKNIATKHVKDMDYSSHDVRVAIITALSFFIINQIFDYVIETGILKKIDGIRSAKKIKDMFNQLNEQLHEFNVPDREIYIKAYNDYMKTKTDAGVNVLVRAAAAMNNDL